MWMRIVMKFGGSSLADTGRILAAAKRAAAFHRQGNQVILVVSAQGDLTDRLQQRADAISEKPSRRELDLLLSSGEQISAALMTMALHTLDCPAVSLTGWQAGLRTGSRFGDAQIRGISNDRMEQELKRGNILVVTGFQGVTELGDITTLGRGGSDTTAVALAVLLKADRCQIYTDVDGVYDKDPRRFAGAVRFHRISYDRMLALIAAGAQVLHDRSVLLARCNRLPIEVLSSFTDGPGTVVGPM